MTEALRYTVVPGKDTLITAQVSPNAVCRFQPDSAHEEQSLLLFADAAGIVRFHVHPHGPCDDIVEFALTSAKGVSFQLCLRAAEEASTDHPFHVPIQTSHEGARVRPALSLDEAKTLSNEDLVKQGYSPRPKVHGAEGTPSTWLRSVTTAYTWVDSTTVARPDRGPGFRKQHVQSNDATAADRAEIPQTGAVLS